jgi:pimeloyl-[acyl-carrier protein] methyl ester esterase
MSGLFVERLSATVPNGCAALPVVLVHGWAMNAASWGDFPRRLTARRDVYQVELPGHGRSPWGGDDRLERWAEHVSAAVPPGAVWVGWSLGAAVAVQAALDRPQVVRSLVLITGTPRFTQATDWPHAMEPRALAQFSESVGNAASATVKRFLALQVRGSADASSTLRRLYAALHELPEARQEALATGLDLLRTTDLRRRLRTLKLPMLWLLGERDTLVPAAMAWSLTEWLPDARIEIIEGAGHAPFLSHLPLMLARVEPFLEQLDG